MSASNRIHGPIAELRRSRTWPEGIPIPKPGPYSVGHVWTWDDEQSLKKYYRRYGPLYCARLLGRTPAGVQTRATLLGLGTGRRCRLWTTVDDAYLRENHLVMSRDDIAKKLGRSRVAVNARMSILRLSPRRASVYTERELAIIRKHHGRLSYAEIAAKVGRSPHALTTQIANMGLARKREDLKLKEKHRRYIRKNFNGMSLVDMAAHLGFSPSTVGRVAREMGLRARPTTRPWTRSDDARLRKIYGTMRRTLVAAQMGRTLSGVALRARALGIARPTRRGPTRRWTEAEDRFLRDNVLTMSRRELARHLNRSVTTVQGRMQSKGIRKYHHVSPNRPWTPDEEAFLKKHVSSRTRPEMAEALGRTVVAIGRRLGRLGLGETKTYYLPPRPWTPSDDRKLTRLVAGGATGDEIAARLKRSIFAVQHRKKELGLTNPKRGRG